MSEVDLVMKRLAEADPAPADEALSYGASSSVLFDTICERSGEMKPVTTTPWWRRGPVVAVAVFVLVVAAGFVILMAGATPDSEVVTPNEPTTAPPTTVATTATPTTAEVQTAAVDDALGLWEARYGPNSDPSIWAGYLSPDSPAFAPSDWEWIDDFDRDGVVAFADWMQFQIAMNSAFGTTAEYECEEVSADTAQCGVTATDFFYQVGGAEPPGFEVLMTFESGILAVEEPVEAANAATHERLRGEAEEDRYGALVAYEEWVNRAYPDRYAGLFEAPCCDVAWVTLPEAVPEHEELMTEYLRLIEPKAVEIVRDRVEDLFTATGSAVDAGLFCSDGGFEIHDYVYNGQEQSEVWQEIFTCADGSGTLAIDISASYMVVEWVIYTGSWEVVEGFGDYAAVAGSGAFTAGTLEAETPWTYSGELSASG